MLSQLRSGVDAGSAVRAVISQASSEPTPDVDASHLDDEIQAALAQRRQLQVHLARMSDLFEKKKDELRNRDEKVALVSHNDYAKQLESSPVADENISLLPLNTQIENRKPYLSRFSQGVFSDLSSSLGNIDTLCGSPVKFSFGNLPQHLLEAPARNTQLESVKYLNHNSVDDDTCTKLLDEEDSYQVQDFFPVREDIYARKLAHYTEELHNSNKEEIKMPSKIVPSDVDFTNNRELAFFLATYHNNCAKYFSSLAGDKQNDNSPTTTLPSATTTQPSAFPILDTGSPTPTVSCESATIDFQNSPLGGSAECHFPTVSENQSLSFSSNIQYESSPEAPEEPPTTTNIYAALAHIKKKQNSMQKNSINSDIITPITNIYTDTQHFHELFNNQVLNNQIQNDNVLKNKVHNHEVQNENVLKNKVLRDNVHNSNVLKNRIHNNEVHGNEVHNNEVRNNDIYSNEVYGNEVIRNKIYSNEVYYNGKDINTVDNNEIYKEEERDVNTYIDDESIMYEGEEMRREESTVNNCRGNSSETEGMGIHVCESRKQKGTRRDKRENMRREKETLNDEDFRKLETSSTSEDEIYEEKRGNENVNSYLNDGYRNSSMADEVYNFDMKTMKGGSNGMCKSNRVKQYEELDVESNNIVKENKNLKRKETIEDIYEDICMGSASLVAWGDEEFPGTESEKEEPSNIAPIYIQRLDSRLRVRRALEGKSLFLSGDFDRDCLPLLYGDSNTISSSRNHKSTFLSNENITDWDEMEPLTSKRIGLEGHLLSPLKLLDEYEELKRWPKHVVELLDQYSSSYCLRNGGPINVLIQECRARSIPIPRR